MSGDMHVRKPALGRPHFLKLEYREAHAIGARPQHPIAVVRFGERYALPSAEVLTIDVDLSPLRPAPAEVWYSDEPVSLGCEGMIRFACDSSFVFGVIEVNESEYQGVREATASAYAAIREFQRAAGFPHLLRMWNFLDAVNQGEGDLERYRQFCVGRAEGIDSSITGEYPAATAIGRQLSTGVLQVIWIASKEPGAAIENPRQVSAYRYPRAHGPVSPSFSRATMASDGTLLISGTASIVGHASQHPNDTLAQLEETLLNLKALVEHARQQRSVTAADSPLLFKTYVRRSEDLEPIASRLEAAFPTDRMIYLAADICRRELLLEIECVLQPR
jgi:chorismate lyase / 3-hydroxybenzoate synthase